jgi:hypothetical protein
MSKLLNNAFNEINKNKYDDQLILQEFRELKRSVNLLAIGKGGMIDVEIITEALEELEKMKRGVKEILNKYKCGWVNGEEFKADLQKVI